MSDYEYFSDKELGCRCGNHDCSTASKMNPDFMFNLVRLRQIYNKPMYITSAHRCPSHNAAVSAGRMIGAHTKGLAVDVAVSGREAYKIVQLAVAVGITGIGISQKGSHTKRFIHLDMLPEGETRPWIWSY